MQVTEDVTLLECRYDGLRILLGWGTKVCIRNFFGKFLGKRLHERQRKVVLVVGGS